MDFFLKEVASIYLLICFGILGSPNHQKLFICVISGAIARAKAAIFSKNDLFFIVNTPVLRYFPYCYLTIFWVDQSRGILIFYRFYSHIRHLN